MSDVPPGRETGQTPRLIAIGIGAAVLVLLLVVGGWGSLQTASLGGLATFQIPSVLMVAGAAAAGALITWGVAVQRLTAEEARRLGYAALMPTIGLAGTLLLLASVPQLSPPRAAAALLLGTLALIAAWRCIELLSAGEPIGFESHWGGLGGGSGGWRLFPASALAILSLSFAGGALAVLVSEPAKTTAAASTSPPGNTSTEDDTGDNATEPGNAGDTADAPEGTGDNGTEPGNAASEPDEGDNGNTVGGGNAAANANR